MWDVSFSISSLVSGLLLGVALGNIAWGVPLAQDHEFAGTFFGLLNPYSLLVGVTTVSLFIMHGAIYMVLKTEGELHEKLRGWVNRTIIIFVICYVSTTVITIIFVPHMLETLREYPIFFGLAILNMLAVANIPREIHHRRDFRAFLSSCASMAALLALFGIGMFPNLVYAINDPANSLNIYNAASSQKTLWIMLIIAMIGVPIVISYTVSIYWVFRGKVRLDRFSY
jgi:cytochrome d ubiquinol oxidase subunit II